MWQLLIFHPSLFCPTPGFASCTEVTRKWGQLSHAQNTVTWLVLSEKSVEVTLKPPCLQVAFLRSNIIAIIIIICYQCANGWLCDKCTEAPVVSEVLIIIGASLSEINTSVTSLHTYVCMLYRFVGLEWPLSVYYIFICLTNIEHLA